MAFLTESEVRLRASQAATVLQKSASRQMFEAAAADASFDVFLSHSSAEPEHILLGVKAMLEDRNLSVYVDKYCDPQMSPEAVTIATAETLRKRMQASRSLLFIYSPHSTKSRWMPWELGYFDGLKGKVGIIPVTKSQEEAFKGEEYLNLYPFVDQAQIKGESKSIFWINHNQQASTYAPLDKWIMGTQKMIKHP